MYGVTLFSSHWGDWMEKGGQKLLSNSSCQCSKRFPDKVSHLRFFSVALCCGKH